MTEWHIFTKDKNEYYGSKLSFQYKGFATLESYSRVIYNIEETKWFGLKKKQYKEIKDISFIDYMIPLDQVIRIERWDVDKLTDKEASHER